MMMMMMIYLNFKVDLKFIQKSYESSTLWLLECKSVIALFNLINQNFWFNPQKDKHHNVEFQLD